MEGCCAECAVGLMLSGSCCCSSHPGREGAVGTRGANVECHADEINQSCLAVCKQQVDADIARRWDDHPHKTEEYPGKH